MSESLPMRSMSSTRWARALLTLVLACAAAAEDQCPAERAPVDIVEAYRPLRAHPELFETDSRLAWRRFVHAPLLAALESGNATALGAMLRTEVDGVYSFELFSREFCTLFLEELDAYYASGLPIDRPNSMNNYGIIGLWR